MQKGTTLATQDLEYLKRFDNIKLNYLPISLVEQVIQCYFGDSFPLKKEEYMPLGKMLNT